MARSGQAFFARSAIVCLLVSGGCTAADGPGALRGAGDGTPVMTPDPASRERQERLERRRQDDQIQREIYNWLPPFLRRG
jgi:hypothetical protein